MCTYDFKFKNNKKKVLIIIRRFYAMGNEWAVLSMLKLHHCYLEKPLLKG